MTKVRIGGAALNQTPIDWSDNLTNILSAITDAINKNVKILCLPELCITGYGCEDLFLSDWIFDKAINQLLRILPTCTNISVAIGLPVKYQGLRYNCTAYIRDKQIKGIYAKQQLANDGVHYEPRWFSPWPTDKVESIEIHGLTVPIGDITVQDNDLNIAFEICEDAWRRPACRMEDRNIDLIINPSASHFAFNKSKRREQLVIEGSKTINCAYLYANLLGNEAGRMIYDGDIIIAQKGILIARNKRLSFRDYNFTYTDVDFADPDNSIISINEEIAGNNYEFSLAVSLALFDYLRKAKSKGFVLSLSGGADSSCIATLVAEVVRNALKEMDAASFLKKLNIKLNHAYDGLAGIELQRYLVSKILYTAYQGTVNSSTETYESAKNLAEWLGANFYHWKIDEEINDYKSTIEEALGECLTWTKHDITLQNIQARARSPIIWMLANIKNALLLATSNRSEGDVGYTTMDGDTSGGLSPIAGIDKHFIRQWLVFAERELGYQGLNMVNKMEPTAELRPLSEKQSDEKDLMPYEIMAKIERFVIRDKRSPKEVFDLINNETELSSEEIKIYLSKFYSLWSRNQWKRERLAPSFHIDEFNIDPRSWYRYPILSGGYDSEINEIVNLK